MAATRFWSLRDFLRARPTEDISVEGMSWSSSNLEGVTFGTSGKISLSEEALGTDGEIGLWRISLCDANLTMGNNRIEITTKENEN